MDHCNVHKQKSHTFAADTKKLIIQKYLESTRREQANYANVPADNQTPPVTPVHHQQNYHVHHPSRVSHHSRSHHHVHSRTFIQHYYRPLFTHDVNSYYNMPNVGMTRSHHSPVLNRPPPPPHMHNPPQLDCITVMHVCNELGNNIDSSPPMPESRQYSVIRFKQTLVKLAYPQMRTTKSDFLDHRTRTYVKAGETISVLGPTKDDRSMVSICYRGQHLVIPHQLTRPPPLDRELHVCQQL